MTTRPTIRRSRLLAAAVPLALVLLAGIVLLGSTLSPPPPTPPPVAQLTPATSAPPSAAPTAAASPTPAPATPLPSFVLPSPFEEYYPSIAPSTPLASAEPGPRVIPADGRATRVVIPSLRIDLPVVAGDLKVRGNRNDYPLCDVAQYMTVFGQPGDEGTVYIYSHAQKGMFLPMLRASWRNNGRELIGARVEVYTSDSKLHTYEIVRVKRHSTDLKIAYNVPKGEHQLILQTSEGPPGHRPVLQVKASPVSVAGSTAAEAMPTPKPRACVPRR